MTFAATIKKPVKALFSQFPVLDILSRRFLYRSLAPNLFYHEPEMKFFDSLPKGSIDVAVDVGAAMGSYCWILEKAARDIYAFEPGRVHNRILNQASKGTNIHVIRAAVGSAPGKVQLYTPSADSNDRYSASISLENPVTQSATAIIDEVDQVTLDTYFASNLPAGRSIDLLKVDVEGYELEAFKGAVELIRTHKPLVICEIEARHNPAYKEVFDLLKGLGYGVFVFRNGRFGSFVEENIEPYQLAKDLEKRLHGTTEEKSDYVNNFVFQHPDSKVKVG